MELKTEQLDLLTREELLVVLKALLGEVEMLRQRVTELEAENERLRKQSTNSRNSSQPPSRDQKVNQPEKKGGKQGPPYGHTKYRRELIEKPDRVISAAVTECDQCHAELSGTMPEGIERRQITELPEVKAVVIETQQHRVVCPHCQRVNRGRLPEGLQAERYFGPNLEATVIFYKQTQHLSYERIVETMRDLHGVSLSEGAIAAILERAGERAKPAAEAIKEAVISGDVVRSDETSARVKGRNWWQWVFISEQGIYHTIVPTRSAAEITSVMGQAAVKVWVCDCFGAQLKAPAEVFQLCLAHQLRDLRRVIETTPEDRWAPAAQELFQNAIHLRNRFISGEMTLEGFLRRVAQIENQLDLLLDEEVANLAARRLQARFSNHRDKLLTFLSYPEVPPTNNESERALRPSVIHRKVTNGFRSEWGAKAYAALQSVIATAKLKGQPVFDLLVRLMGTPVLHFVDAPSP